MNRPENDPHFEEVRRDLRHELDQRSAQDDEFWLTQRREVGRRVRAEQTPERSSTRRTIWAWSGLASATVLLLVLAAGPLGWTTGPHPASVEAAAIDSATADLLRSVEFTLASDVAPPLSAADLLLAELETGYTATFENRSDPETGPNP